MNTYGTRKVSHVSPHVLGWIVYHQITSINWLIIWENNAAILSKVSYLWPFTAGIVCHGDGFCCCLMRSTQPWKVFAQRLKKDATIYIFFLINFFFLILNVSLRSVLKIATSKLLYEKQIVKMKIVPWEFLFEKQLKYYFSHIRLKIRIKGLTLSSHHTFHRVAFCSSTVLFGCDKKQKTDSIWTTMTWSNITLRCPSLWGKTKKKQPVERTSRLSSKRKSKCVFIWKVLQPETLTHASL